MTPELALRLGRAIAWVARGSARGSSPHVVIGKDTRLSGYMLETALASGICAMGGTVLLSGPIPTPAVANLTHSMRADAGVVISASHNPFQDNGIKLFGPDGFKLPDPQEAAIEALLADTKHEVSTAFGVPSTGEYAARQAFLIKDGKVVWLDLKASTAEQAADVLAALDAMKKQ